MQTPNTPRGRETERLMKLWRGQNPAAEASAYNREWDSVYRKLEGEFSDKKLGFDGYFDTCDAVQDTAGNPSPVAVTPLEPRPPKRICKANYPATKGAFGKPKHLRPR